MMVVVVKRSTIGCLTIPAGGVPGGTSVSCVGNFVSCVRVPVAGGEVGDGLVAPFSRALWREGACFRNAVLTKEGEAK